MSETGFEHAVAAPNVFAKSSIIFQFSGPLRPLPAETTISASAIEISPEPCSTESVVNVESGIMISMDINSGLDFYSTIPNELL